MTTIDLTGYAPEHKSELERLLRSPDWRETLASGLVDEVRAERIEPAGLRDFIKTVVDQLLEFNRERTQALIERGCTDEDRLFSELSVWPDRLAGQDPCISFLGLNLTAECSFEPRCLYCNQPWLESALGLAVWKRIIQEVTVGCPDAGPYVYLTGGEPLLLGEDLWGDDGLIRFATQRGAGVNVNTNGALITPQIALRLIKAGLLRLHISLDTSDRGLHDYLRGGPRFDQVLRGIYNVQLARDIVGVSYPGIHTNCVLTNKNLDRFPQLFAFILGKHKQTADAQDPFINDLFTHAIPVGGDSNDWLRPSRAEFRRFYQEVWPQVSRIWDSYQARLGVPQDKRRALFGYFSNPFLRVEHRGGLEAYVLASSEGRYGKLALARHCYVAPTQASFTPDGYQYRCGSHAIRHLLPLGRISEGGVFDGIREGMAGLDSLPQEEHCYGCALATLYVNQSVEKRLQEELASMLKAAGEG